MPLEDVFARKSAPDVIAEHLRAEILRGNLPGGTQLKQSDIATRFNTSIVPVREAFQRLVADGLASSEHNKGVVVARTSVQEFEEVTDLRIHLEPFALARSAPHLAEADFTAAGAVLERASRSADGLERAALHWEFHRILYAKCAMPRLIAQIASLHLCVNRYVLSVWSSEGLSERWDESHEQIIRALRAGDVDAANAIVIRQINEARDRVLRKILSRGT